MKPILCKTVVVLSLLVGAAGLAVAAQSLIAAQSEVGYVATQMGVAVEGNFSRFDARIDLDPDRLQSSSVSLSVDTASATFPSTEVQRELAKPDWFDSAHFPRAEFRSSRIRALDGGRYEIGGTLTIKGHTGEVTFPVTLSRSGATTVATGSLTIKRLEYGIGQGEWSDTSLVEDPVQIKFKIAFGAAASG
jgi:polyisoprenoid-binding protein YceI